MNSQGDGGFFQGTPGDAPTIIQLDAFGGEETSLRSRTNQPHMAEEHASLEPDFVTSHTREDKRRTAGRRRQTSSPDPLDEFLDILPPSIRKLAIKLGTSLDPSKLQIIGLSKDFTEANPDAYNPGQGKHALPFPGLHRMVPHLVALAVSFIVWMFSELIHPSFFDFPFFYFSSAGVLDAWLLYMWAAVVGGLVWYFRGSGMGRKEEGWWGWRAAVGLGLAVLEELGHRCLYICTIMVGTALFNSFLSATGLYLGLIMTVIGIVLALLTVLHLSEVVRLGGRVRRVVDKYNPVHVLVGCGILAVGGILLVMLGLVYGHLFVVFWDYLLLPAANLFSLWRYDYLFLGAFGKGSLTWDTSISSPTRRRRRLWQQNSDNRLFLIGILIANLLYRDGYKYAGVLGWMNSWYVGLRLVATMTQYGLFTSIAVHLIYELEFFAIGFLISKFTAKAREAF
jgi:hypothetical protein